jgi:hypothetical protein
MNFKEYIGQAWSTHFKDPSKTAEEFANGMALIEESAQIGDLAGIATHVYGEHLARWNDGVGFLQKLKNHPKYISDPVVDGVLARSIAVLNLAANPSVSLAEFTPSERIRVMAVTSSALTSFDIDRATELLRTALSLAERGLAKEDPANRALAVTGNNLAAALEEKSARTAGDVALMVLAAQTGRKYWEISGGWYEVAFAEYRLAMSYVQSGDFDKAWRAAQNCVESVLANNAGPLDCFYGYECLATVEKARGNLLEFAAAVERMKHYSSLMKESERSGCSASFKKLGVA